MTFKFKYLGIQFIYKDGEFEVDPSGTAVTAATGSFLLESVLDEIAPQAHETMIDACKAELGRNFVLLSQTGEEDTSDA